ncbi:MAG: STAS domain-containing protein [Planctomycetes bacterium]|nr:STAS domain-containing protein [Planctomycetota bacterium]
MSHHQAETVHKVAIVTFKGRNLNEANVQAAADQLLQLVAEQGRAQVELDLGDLEAIGGVELAKFVALHKKVRTAGGRLTLSNVAPLVYEVFQITGLNALLDIRPKEVA